MAFFFRKKQTPVTACIVPAAGQGTRMQGAYEETKQLILFSQKRSKSSFTF